MRTMLGLLLLGCSGNSLTIALIEQNASGQNGTATLTDTAKGLVISISVKATGPLPAHVHEGRCDSVGRIVFGVLESGQHMGHSSDGGNSLIEQTFKDRRLETLLAKPHVINLHDPTDLSLYVSCGEIR